MLFLIRRSTESIPIARASRSIGSLLIRTTTTNHYTPRQFSTSLSQRQHLAADIDDTTDTMADTTKDNKDTKEDIKAPKPAANVQIKTPKGTRDWHGPDMLLREQLLYVFPAVFTIRSQPFPCC